MTLQLLGQIKSSLSWLYISNKFTMIAIAGYSHEQQEVQNMINSRSKRMFQMHHADFFVGHFGLLSTHEAFITSALIFYRLLSAEQATRKLICIELFLKMAVSLEHHLHSACGCLCVHVPHGKHAAVWGSKPKKKHFCVHTPLVVF